MLFKPAIDRADGEAVALAVKKDRLFIDLCSVALPMEKTLGVIEIVSDPFTGCFSNRKDALFFPYSIGY